MDCIVVSQNVQPLLIVLGEAEIRDIRSNAGREQPVLLTAFLHAN